METQRANSKRLMALKDKDDPENLFRLNQDIKPSKQEGEPALA
jgi:Berberine and berberine like